MGTIKRNDDLYYMHRFNALCSLNEDRILNFEKHYGECEWSELKEFDQLWFNVHFDLVTNRLSDSKIKQRSKTWLIENGYEFLFP